MDIKGFGCKITDFLKKYRYVALVLAIGLVLMAIPEIGSNDNPEQQANEITVPEETTEEKLSSILSQIEGVGTVRILLTEATGEEVFYQTNENSNSGDNASSIDRDTVIITDADRSQKGLVRQINPPIYLGVIVACQGADDPTVRLAVVDAVSKITGLGANRISVLKMK